jgi:hydrogenase maturation factor
VAYAVNASNTAAVTLTLAPSGGGSLGPKTIKKNGSVDLEDGDLRAGQIVQLRYDGTYWQLLNKPANDEIFTGADAGASDTYAITAAPAPRAYFAGMLVAFKANTANTGAATLNVNTLGAVTIKKQKDVDLADNDIKAGQYVLVVHDGTNFQLFSSPNSQTQYTTPAGSELALSAATSVREETHGLGATPRFMEWAIYCSNAGGDGGYAQNDEIPVRSVIDSAAAAEPPFTEYKTSTKVGIVYRLATRTMRVANKGTYAAQNLDPTKWSLRCNAMR